MFHVNLVLPNSVRLPSLPNLSFYFFPYFAEIELLVLTIKNLFFQRHIIKWILTNFMVELILLLVFIVFLFNLHDYPRKLNSFWFFLLLFIRFIDLTSSFLDLVVFNVIFCEFKAFQNSFDNLCPITVIIANNFIFITVA